MKNNFEDEEMQHELFLKTRQTTKIRNKDIYLKLTICQQM